MVADLTTLADPTSLGSTIGGERWAAHGEHFGVENPASDEPLAEVSEDGAVAVDAAVRAATRAFRGWRGLVPAQRADYLFALADRIDQHQERLSVLESLNVGKPLDNARYEITRTAQLYRYFAGAGRALSGIPAGEYKANITSMMRREPIGVVAAIAPWNYPMALTAWKIAPALVAGNTVVLKPSPYSPLTALLLGEIAADVLPPGTLNVITGGQETGAALVAHRDVDMVSLTGGSDTGVAVMSGAAQGLKRLHLELGGKAPVIVFDDADIARLGKTVAASAYGNSGQDCTAATRVYVDEKVRTDVLDGLVAASAAIEPMHPQEHPSAEMGPLVNRTHRNRVKAVVDGAVETGAEILVGGDADQTIGAYYRPTLVTGLAQRAELVQSELFGPVLAALPFESEREAVEMANDIRYGLAASVWTRDIDRAIRVAREIRAGTVWINDHGPTILEMPFGGFKQSGFGRDLSVASVEEHTELKHVAITTASLD